jgi:RNA polymerase sigma-70 factor (ECF subfamily)
MTVVGGVMDGLLPGKTREGLADAELLAGMRAGNSAAFAALIRSNNQRLYRLARGFLRDDLEAEEAVHDATCAPSLILIASGADRASLSGWRGSSQTKRSGA